MNRPGKAQIITASAMILAALALTWFPCVAAPIAAAGASIILAQLVGRALGPVIAAASALALYWGRIPHAYMLDTPGGAAMMGMEIAVTLAASYLIALLISSIRGE